jgi:hypothetical protein
MKDSSELIFDTALILNADELRKICPKLEEGPGVAGFDERGKQRILPISRKEQQLATSQNLWWLGYTNHLVFVSLGQTAPTAHVSYCQLPINVSSNHEHIAHGRVLKRGQTPPYWCTFGQGGYPNMC